MLQGDVSNGCNSREVTIVSSWPIVLSQQSACLAWVFSAELKILRTVSHRQSSGGLSGEKTGRQNYLRQLVSPIWAAVKVIPASG
ncbi:hypothetical protein TNCV_4750591 [Trichonephila clavipes]|nr:hypothetical protein TNCV_4750591 [Trichonephila clavipes]